MAEFIGKGLLEPYSCEIILTDPVRVADLGDLLHLPKEYASNLITVRGSVKLDFNELVNDGDEIVLFLAPMGG